MLLRGRHDLVHGGRAGMRSTAQDARLERVASQVSRVWLSGQGDERPGLLGYLARLALMDVARRSARDDDDQACAPCRRLARRRRRSQSGHEHDHSALIQDTVGPAPLAHDVTTDHAAWPGSTRARRQQHPHLSRAAAAAAWPRRTDLPPSSRPQPPLGRLKGPFRTAAWPSRLDTHAPSTPSTIHPCPLALLNPLLFPRPQHAPSPQGAQLARPPSLPRFSPRRALR